MKKQWNFRRLWHTSKLSQLPYKTPTILDGIHGLPRTARAARRARTARTAQTTRTARTAWTARTARTPYTIPCGKKIKRRQFLVHAAFFVTAHGIIKIIFWDYVAHGTLEVEDMFSACHSWRGILRGDPHIVARHSKVHSENAVIFNEIACFSNIWRWSLTGAALTRWTL